MANYSVYSFVEGGDSIGYHYSHDTKAEAVNEARCVAKEMTKRFLVVVTKDNVRDGSWTIALTMGGLPIVNTHLEYLVRCP